MVLTVQRDRYDQLVNDSTISSVNESYYSSGGCRDRVAIYFDNAELQATRTVPFSVHGAHNVFLETAKRGDDDDFSSATSPSTTTVVLRLYEAYGGHAQARLDIASDVHVVKAYLTNLLEDPNDEMTVMHVAEDEKKGPSSSYLKLDFRGFEVKTVKLVIGSGLKG